MSNFIEQTLSGSTVQMEMSQTVGKIFTALGELQETLPIIGKNAINPHFGNTYADLAAIIEVANASMHKVGLSYSQIPSADSQNVTVTTIIVHGESGEWIRGSLSMVAKNPGPQAIGSTITYAKRYALQSMIGIGPADEDDDGNAGTELRGGKVTSPSKEEAKPDANGVVYLSDISSKLFAKKGDVKAYLNDTFGVDEFEELSGDQLERAIGDVEMIGTQKMRFVELAKELKYPNKQIIKEIREVGGVDSFARLTTTQRVMILDRFDHLAKDNASE